MIRVVPVGHKKGQDEMFHTLQDLNIMTTKSCSIYVLGMGVLIFLAHAITKLEHALTVENWAHD